MRETIVLISSSKTPWQGTEMQKARTSKMKTWKLKKILEDRKTSYAHGFGESISEKGLYPV